jgi:hypothetical protein
MSRNKRVFVALLLGGLLTTSGMILGYWNSETAGRLIRIDLDGRWPARVNAVAEAAAWSGIFICGLALHAWITAPRDDR